MHSSKNAQKNVGFIGLNKNFFPFTTTIYDDQILCSGEHEVWEDNRFWHIYLNSVVVPFLLFQGNFIVEL